MEEARTGFSGFERGTTSVAETHQAGRGEEYEEMRGVFGIGLRGSLENRVRGSNSPGRERKGIGRRVRVREGGRGGKECGRGKEKQNFHHRVNAHDKHHKNMIIIQQLTTKFEHT